MGRSKRSAKERNPLWFLLPPRHLFPCPLLPPSSLTASLLIDFLTTFHPLPLFASFPTSLSLMARYFHSHFCSPSNFHSHFFSPFSPLSPCFQGHSRLKFFCFGTVAWQPHNVSCDLVRLFKIFISVTTTRA